MRILTRRPLPRGSYTYAKPKHFAWIRVSAQRRSVIWQRFWHRRSALYRRRVDRFL